MTDSCAPHSVGKVADLTSFSFQHASRWANESYRSQCNPCLFGVLSFLCSRVFGTAGKESLPLSDFLNAVGLLKFRGTSVLFRLSHSSVSGLKKDGRSVDGQKLYADIANVRNLMCLVFKLVW